MIAIVAALSMGLLQDSGAEVSAVALVSKMLAFYNDAQSLTGRITLTQSANDTSGTVETVIQFESPNKLYIRQQKSVGEKRVFLVVSDGKKFSYDSPVRDGKRLTELVTPAPGYGLTFREIYAAASAGIADRSTPLDIAIGRREDLTYLRNQWETIRYEGTTKFGEETVHVVMGNWRPYGEGKTEGQYRMYITGNGELRQFALSLTLRPTPAAQPVTALSTWTVKLTKNGKPDPSLFQVR